jgi:hypothetical protein
MHAILRWDVQLWAVLGLAFATTVEVKVKLPQEIFGQKIAVATEAWANSELGDIGMHLRTGLATASVASQQLWR